MVRIHQDIQVFHDAALAKASSSSNRDVLFPMKFAWSLGTEFGLVLPRPTTLVSENIAAGARMFLALCKVEKNDCDIGSA